MDHDNLIMIIPSEMLQIVTKQTTGTHVEHQLVDHNFPEAILINFT